MNKKEAVEKHLLVSKSIGCIGTWEHWKELWDKTDELEILHSLLHFGFDIYTTDEQYSEKMTFYLELADGYDDSIIFHSANDATRSGYYETAFGRKMNNELKQLLSQKAFHVLCKNIFKDAREKQVLHTPRPSWFYPVFQEAIFKKILWFFRTNKYGCISNAHSNEKHLKKTVEIFLYDLCKCVWSEDKYLCECTAWLEPLYPELIAILHGIRRIDILLDRDVKKNITDNEGYTLKSVMNKLEKLALEFEKSYNGEKRRPTSLNEAYYGGSQAAKVYILLSIEDKERRRLEKIQELERQHKETERRLKELQK